MPDHLSFLLVFLVVLASGGVLGMKTGMDWKREK